MNKTRRIATIVELVLGIILLVCGIAGLVDEFWTGMGSGLLFVGILQLIRQIRYNTNADYKEKFDTNSTDERNRFLAMKAWSWAGYLYVMIAAVGTIGFQLAGRRELSVLCSGSLCLVIVLYWLSYVILKRKY